MVSVWRPSRLGSPEDPVLSYIPDNDSVDVIINDEENIRLIRSNDGSGLQNQ